MIQERASSPRNDEGAASLNEHLYSDPSIWLFLTVNTLQALAFFLPALYLPAYAEALSLPSSSGSATIAAINGAAILSRVGMGALADRRSPHALAVGSLLLSGVAVVSIWGTSRAESSLVTFAFVYGCLAAGYVYHSRCLSDVPSSDFLRRYTSLWAGHIRLVTTDQHTAAKLFGLLSFTRGLGGTSLFI